MNPRQNTISILETLAKYAPSIEVNPTPEDARDLRKSSTHSSVKDDIKKKLTKYRMYLIEERCRKTRIAIGSSVLTIWVERAALQTAISKIKKLPLKAWDVGQRQTDDWTFLD